MAVIKGKFPQNPAGEIAGKKDEAVPLYTFHFSLSFSSPTIWRRIQVPGSLNLKQFHDVVQRCMGWNDNFGHQFYAGKIFYTPRKAGNPKYFEGDVRLFEIEEAIRWCFSYIYDAGDGWEINIYLEEADVKKLSFDEKIPKLVDGEYAGPPESVENIHTYSSILNEFDQNGRQTKTLHIPEYELDGFDPLYIDVQGINTSLRFMFSPKLL